MHFITPKRNNILRSYPITKIERHAYPNNNKQNPNISFLMLLYCAV